VKISSRRLRLVPLNLTVIFPGVTVETGNEGGLRDAGWAIVVAPQSL
jgi:hypothetical protein